MNGIVSHPYAYKERNLPQRFPRLRQKLTIEYSYTVFQIVLCQSISYNPYTLFLFVRCCVTSHVGILSVKKVPMRRYMMKLKIKGLRISFVSFDGYFSVSFVWCDGIYHKIFLSPKLERTTRREFFPRQLWWWCLQFYDVDLDLKKNRSASWMCLSSRQSPFIKNVDATCFDWELYYRQLESTVAAMATGYIIKTLVRGAHPVCMCKIPNHRNLQATRIWGIKFNLNWATAELNLICRRPVSMLSLVCWQRIIQTTRLDEIVRLIDSAWLCSHSEWLSP